MSHWLETSNDALWVYGIPGAGKTMLSTLVVDEVLTRKRSASIGTAYFYIRHDDPNSHKPAHVLGSIVSQLARQKSSALASLMELYTQHRSESSLAEYDELTEALHQMAQLFTNTYIMIDGLDECGPIFDLDRKRLLEVVSGLHHMEGNPIRTLIFSRDEHDIKKGLSDAGFRSVSIAATSADLRLFASAWLPSLEIQSEQLRMEIVDTLVEQANGM